MGSKREQNIVTRARIPVPESNTKNNNVVVYAFELFCVLGKKKMGEKEMKLPGFKAAKSRS